MFMSNYPVAVKVTATSLIILAFSACSSPADISITHKGYLECFRLDREPFDAELDARCTDPAAREPKTGTYHRDPAQEMKSDIAILSMAKDDVIKLPVSDCLWVGSSGSGAGDRLAPLWEATLDLDFDNDGLVDWHVASCRLDPPYPRVSLSDPNVRSACLSRNKSIRLSEPAGLGDIKSTCDIRGRRPHNSVELAFQRPEESVYGQCGNYAGPNLPVANFPNVDRSSEFCAGVDVMDDGQILFDNTLLPREDGVYVVESAVDKVLSPGIRTVMGARSIARRLSFDSGQPSWQTPVVAQGEGSQQRWHENFTDAVRVERIRVFSVTNSVIDDRDYVSLDGATLQLTDPDGTTGAGNICSGADDSIDLLSCQIDVTPTYRPANLNRLVLPVLTTPLTWSIDSEQIEDNGREYYIEFDLVSTYRSRQAALMAEIPNVDFGGVTVGEYDHTMIRFSSVGSGHFVIDSVSIAPQSSQPAVFQAHRLDDPISVPHPVSLNDAEGSYGQSVEIESWAQDSPMYELQVMENGLQLSQPALHETTMELFGEPVSFAGNTAVAQSAQPAFSGYSTATGKTYPFNFPVYRHWSLPYTLAPGESRTVQVMARPTHPGEIEGKLLVSGYPYHDPSLRYDVELPLKVTGMTGPQVDHLPAVLRFPRGIRAANTLNVVLVSYGDADLNRGDIKIVESSGNAHAGDSRYFSIDSNAASTATLPPGSSELIPISYDPGCFNQMAINGEHVAVLRIETDAGVRQIALRGDPARWAETSPNCQIGP